MPADESPTDEEIIEGCRRGRPPAQEALYRRHWPFAMSVCLRYAPTREDALEVAHDAFLNAFRALDRFERGRPFRPWFRRVLVRCAVDHHRSTRRHRRTVETAADPPEVAAPAAVLDALQADDVLRLLAALSADERAVFNLYEVEGYSHDEIAGLLGVAPGTSRSHLARAKRRLRALYHEHHGATP